MGFKEYEKYIVEESLTNNTYRRRMVFDNGYGVVLLENIEDNNEEKNTWCAFVIKQTAYDEESDQDYIFLFNTEINKDEMRNVTLEKIQEIIKKVMSWNS